MAGTFGFVVIGELARRPLLMKRVYRQSYLSRNPKTLIARFSSSVVRNRRKLLVASCLAVLALFAISCILVGADAVASRGTQKTNSEVKGAGGQTPDPPGIAAKSAILVDAVSGRVLFERNAHLKMPIASTTKMMTALVVREQLEMDDTITVSPEASAVGEQEIWLDPGEELTVEQLLYALLVQSANDAAFALAECTTGSDESFARLMNKMAGKIGVKESHFTNPHGLDETEHYSTAYDLALIGRELLSDPVLAKMVATRVYEIPWPGHPAPRTCISHNELLEKYPGANGIKTGYTAEAGRCLVGSATRDGKTLIAVALNSEYRESDVASMLDYGFEATELVVMVKNGQRIGRTRVSNFPKRYVDVVPESEVRVLSLKGAGDVFRVEILMKGAVGHMVVKNAQLGSVECWLEDKKVISKKAVAAESVGRTNFLAGIFIFLWYAICKMGWIISSPFRIF